MTSEVNTSLSQSLEKAARRTDFVIVNMTNDFFEHLQAFADERVPGGSWISGWAGKPGVEIMGECTSFEPSCIELWSE